MSSLCRTEAALLALLALAGCDRETRDYRSAAMAAADRGAAFEGNAFHIAQGQRLYGWMNCSGCHAHGGGGMGPPLMDDEWRYGGSMREIAATILDGRPNGMPSFRGRITEDQAWQLAAFVRRYVGPAAPGRAPGPRRRAAQHRADDARRAQADPACDAEAGRPERGMSAFLDTIQSAAGNDGQQSALVSGLFSIFLIVTAIVYVAVILFLLWAIFRRRRRRKPRGRSPLDSGRLGRCHRADPRRPHHRHLARRPRARLRRGHAGAGDRDHRQPMVVGRPLPDDEASEIFRTANELHLPVGVPAHITLQLERRDPQLLGAEPRRQAGHDPGPRATTSASRRSARASTAASAPSSAASSTPRWRST